MAQFSQPFFCVPLGEGAIKTNHECFLRPSCGAICVRAHEPEKGAAWANNFASIHHGAKSGGAFQRQPLYVECVWVLAVAAAAVRLRPLCTLNQTHERVRERDRCRSVTFDCESAAWIIVVSHRPGMCRRERPCYLLLLRNSRLWKLIIARRLIPLANSTLFVWLVIFCFWTGAKKCAKQRALMLLSTQLKSNVCSFSKVDCFALPVIEGDNGQSKMFRLWFRLISHSLLMHAFIVKFSS